MLNFRGAILLMEEILHQLIGSLSVYPIYLPGFSTIPGGARFLASTVWLSLLILWIPSSLRHLFQLTFHITQAFQFFLCFFQKSPGRPCRIWANDKKTQSLNLVGGWSNPSEKYWIIFPRFRGENKKHLSYHHLENPMKIPTMRHIYIPRTQWLTPFFGELKTMLSKSPRIGVISLFHSISNDQPQGPPCRSKIWKPSQLWFISGRTVASWWLNQPIWKICSSN